jgi:hypothetical protein
LVAQREEHLWGADTAVAVFELGPAIQQDSALNQLSHAAPIIVFRGFLLQIFTALSLLIGFSLRFVQESN